MKIQRCGIEMKLPDLQRSFRLPGRTNKESPKRGMVLAYFKEYLEALIHDERYEEAGKLNEKFQEFKRSCV